MDRKIYIARKRIEHETNGGRAGHTNRSQLGGVVQTHNGVYFPSLSSRTIVYKGMLTTNQLAGFYPDLIDERVESALALVHSRFSTNTFPARPLAHPYRTITHNGEINTIAENRTDARKQLKHPTPRTRTSVPNLHTRRIRHRRV